MLAKLAADLSSEAHSSTVDDGAPGPSAVLEHYHHALGHLHYRGVIKFMEPHGIPITDSDRQYSRSRINCASCGSFKNTKKSIAKLSISESVTPGHTVYADQMAFPKVPGDEVRGKYKTSIIFVDKSTGFTRLYPLKTSGHSAEAYKDFVDYLSRSPHYRGHKRLHTDRGTEFVNKYVRKVAEGFNAMITNTGAECHERIGVVERRVQIVKESTGAVFCGSRLPRHFYGYVAAEIVRRRNYLPRKDPATGATVTPMPMLMGTDSKVSDLSALPLIGARCTAIHVRVARISTQGAVWTAFTSVSTKNPVGA